MSRPTAKNAREAMKARRERDAGRTSPEATERPTAAPERRSAPVVRTQRVRRTVDLAPTDHAELGQWCAGVAAELGLARVTGQQVLEVLVRRLLDDEDLAADVRKEISRSVSQ